MGERRGNGGRTTTATNGSWYFWLLSWVLTSIPDNQHPYPGWEWYQPIAFSNRPTYESSMKIQCQVEWRTTNPFALVFILHHVFVRLTSSINTSLCSLYGESKRVYDHQGVSYDFPLHETHDLVWYTRTRMDDLDIPLISQHTRRHLRPKFTILISATADILHDLK